MDRREFLRASALGMLASSAGIGAGIGSERARAAARFGDLNFLRADAPNPWSPVSFPNERPISRVLEIFLYGGLSPWETFYLNPNTASGGACSTTNCQSASDSGRSQWGTFECQFRNIADNDVRRPAGASLTKEFYEDVHLGPATYPLWRPDLFDHLQVLVTNHDLLPHEAAVPYSLTGARLGRPNMTGTATAVNKAYSAGGIPAAFVVKGAGGTASDGFAAATADGRLGSSNRPIIFSLSDRLNTLTELDRPPTPDEDLLLRYYIDQYRRRLTWPSATSRARSRAFSDYEGTLEQFFSLERIAGQVRGFDPATPLVAGAEPACVAGTGGGGPSSELSGVRQALSLAGYLLRLPNTRYVCVIDTGREPIGGAGYDSHSNHAHGQYRNLTSTLEILGRMTDPSAVGGPLLDPFTAIVITTEFGRTPKAENAGTGRGHYPYAYANLFIPPNNAIKPRPPRRILGGIDENGRVFTRFGAPVGAITPTDLRGALLVALGIDPFAENLFGVGDFSEPVGRGSEATARANMVREVLGYEF